MTNLQIRIQAHLKNICLPHASRHTASPGELAASEYIESVFKSYGLTCRREVMPVRGWDFNSFSFRDETTGADVPTAQICHFSGTVHATQKLLFLPGFDTDAPDYPDVKGQICFAPVAKGVWENNKLALDLEKKGALAVIFGNLEDNFGMPSTKIVRPADVERIGLCSVAGYGAAYLAAHRNDVFSLQIDAHPYDTMGFNVIGTLGNGPKLAAFGAHKDAAPCIQGASDDATGCAMLLELARELRGKTGDYTVDFVAFTGEEYITHPGAYPPGSTDYANRHKDELAFYFNLDGGSQPSTYTDSVLGAGHLEKMPPLDLNMEIVPPFHKGDDWAFDMAGIPTFWYGERVLPGIKMPIGLILHTVYDNIDAVDFDVLEERYITIRGLAEKILSAK